MPSSKHIVIKHEDLHSSVRNEVRKLIEERNFRRDTTGKTAGIMTLASIGGAGHFDANYHFSTDVLIDALLAGCTFTGGMTMYKLGSRDVRKQTKKVGQEISAKGVIDAEGKYKINNLRETHPYAFVNGKGDVVLVPKTIFQKALKKAQETFLREFIPGRYRIKL